MAMTDATLGGDLVRKGLYGTARTPEYQRFQTSVLVEMDVDRGDGHIVVVMLASCEATRQIALVMIVDIAECCDAGLPGTGSRLACQGFPDDVADRFRAALIAPVFGQPIDGGKQIVVDRDRHALQEEVPIPLDGFNCSPLRKLA